MSEHIGHAHALHIGDGGAVDEELLGIDHAAEVFHGTRGEARGNTWSYLSSGYRRANSSLKKSRHCLVSRKISSDSTYLASDAVQKMPMSMPS